MAQSFLSNVSFLKSITNIKDKPTPKLPELAVVGRSNVGKSSLINSIFNQKKLAKISSTPGKTRLINYFLVNNKFYFVDLPGYGFARVSKQDTEKWKKMIENYLKDNSDLRLVLLLVDSRRGIMQIDITTMDWLSYYQINYKIVLTKVDKISNNELSKTKSKVIEQIEDENVMVFSSKNGKGRNELINLLNYEMNLKN
ncbi:MAG: YihA family ribosome biogenesis GTP-binding protein [Calditrichia bacterium]|nr:YihA family ribosome biogenesis GTP-binding protein [Calditrichia bacterium]